MKTSWQNSASVYLSQIETRESFGWSRKISFYCFEPGKGSHSRLMTSRLCDRAAGASDEFYSAHRAGHKQPMFNSQIGWHQGKVWSIINLPVSTCLGLQCCSQESLLPVKTTWACMSGLYLYLLGNLELGNSMWRNYSLNCYQFHSSTAIPWFHIFAFPTC